MGPGINRRDQVISVRGDACREESSATKISITDERNRTRRGGKCEDGMEVSINTLALKRHGMRSSVE